MLIIEPWTVALEGGTGNTGGGGGGNTTPIPTLTVLDPFTRANANTLAPNWQQLTANLGAGGGGVNGGIRVNNNQAFCVNNGSFAQNLLCGAGANAYWNGGTQPFGTKQAAAFTFSNTTLNNASLYLKASGTITALGNYPNAIRVRYTIANGGQITVATTTGTNGLVYAQQGTVLNVTGGFANGDTLTAMADAAGVVSVWKTTGGATPTTTFVGQVTVATSGTNAFPLAIGTGRIGMNLPTGGRVDNFAGGTVLP